MFKVLTFAAIELSYLIWGIFCIFAFPFMNYAAPCNSLMGRIRFPISAYSIAVGILYLISLYFISRRKLIGLKLAIIANTLGILLLIPILLGLESLFYFIRPEIREQFK
jgi:hypothetical protein